MLYSEFYFSSPIGIVRLELADAGLRSCTFVEEEGTVNENHPVDIQRIKEILQSYFETGTLQEFPIDPTIGTSFQQKVWTALKGIPAGSTTTYAEIAKRLDMPKGAQAVGNANGQNPILLFYPCHRVIGSTGNLVGYSGGLWRKEWLLAKEGATLF
ncbi:MAG: methylated-DNA--[protein]-cysteine S-methyltransferase [Cytophagales bacterium]|jgi:methylated-DNA-[protein]-cysteine S-methyltransferase|nr:methylated-DNA--[protein]-cysteine S-methyltransferase [Cytophagales bacterium]